MAPSSSPPFPAPPARKQKHQETKSTFHLLSLFFQRFQGQQSRCGEAWRKTARGRVWLRDCGVCCCFKGLGEGGAAAVDTSGFRPMETDGGKEGGKARTGGLSGGRGQGQEASGSPAGCSLPHALQRWAQCWLVLAPGRATRGTGAPPPAPCCLAPHPLLPPTPAQCPHQASGLFRKTKPAPG